LSYVELPVDDPARRRPDITKARTLLGWEPRIGLKEGLTRSLDFFRSKIA
jgi:dTDP-glucose 4,6-dehydratase